MRYPRVPAQFVVVLLAAAVTTAAAAPPAADEVTALRERLAQQQAVNESLRRVVETLQAEVAELQQVVQKLHADHDRRLDQSAALRDEQQKTQMELMQARETIAKLEAMVAEMKGRRAEGQQSHAELDARCAALEAALAESQKTAAVLREENKMLRQRLGPGAAVPSPAAPAPAPTASPSTPPAPPTTPLVAPEAVRPVAPRGLDGVVLAVRDELVEVSLGSDDGLRRGHWLEVIRKVGNQSIYVGRIEVARTTPDKSACKVLPEFEQRKLRQGDVVVSSL